MRINVNVDTRQLTQQINRLISEAPTTLGAAVAESAEYIAGTSKTLSAVDTGNLKNSINVNYKNGGMTAEIGTPVHYAPHVEFGTRFMRAQPFLFPAFESGRNIFINNIRNAARNL